MNNVHASHLLLGHVGASWLDTSSLPEFHAQGLLGSGQVVGLGDTGVDVRSCAFADSEDVPYDVVSSSHRKIAAYFTLHGDQLDGPDGHGTHIAGSIASEAPSLGHSGSGVAPAARLAIVDLEHSAFPGQYDVPDANIGTAYFELLRHAGAAVACSPWSYEAHPALETSIDRYVWEHPEFLPVFPSGNSFVPGAQQPHAPCGSKNVLCVGASYNARESYLDQPSFIDAALRIHIPGCLPASSAACSEEVLVLPALFGATAPKDMVECQATAALCLDTSAACPECAFDTAALGSVSEALVAEASPSDGCQALQSFPRGAVCLVQRGACPFATKASFCAEAGAVGVIIVNYANSAGTLMTRSSTDVDVSGLAIPVVLLSDGDASKLLSPGHRVTFPLVSEEISPNRRAPYSAFGPLSNGRLKPEVIFPGDNIASTASEASCSTRYMSGTSQSCAFAAGTAALVREYLQKFAEAETARIALPWASTLKAVLAAAARPLNPSLLMQQDTGFGFPILSRVLPFLDNGGSAEPQDARLVALQSGVSTDRPQQFCFNVNRTANSTPPPQFVLAWTDPPAKFGALVHDLDLVVVCSGSSWLQRLGNDQLQGVADSINTIEKVVLADFQASGPPTEACVASIVMKTGASGAAQPFSLLAAGALAPLPSCERPPELCGGGGAAGGGAYVGGRTCECADSWFGPFCNQKPKELLTDNEAVTQPALPWQWHFFKVPPCGNGLYKFELSGLGTDEVAVAAAATPGPKLWSSSALAPGRADVWQDGDFVFSTEGFSASGLLLVQVQGQDDEEPQSDMHIAVFNRRREGVAELTLRWVDAPSSCQLPVSSSSLRGSQTTQASSSDGLFSLYLLLGLSVPVLVSCTVIGCYLKGKRRSLAAVAPSVEVGSPACAAWQTPTPGTAP